MAAKIPPLEQKYVKSKIANLNASILVAESQTEKHATITRHIASVEDDPLFQLDPEFPLSLDWFNSAPLSFAKELKGKIVVLDFFTYCCINCMHVLPDLESLEHRYPATEGVVITGVHSAKFGNEKMSENIKNAIERYGITHPVVNDKQIELWERLGVTCWPTLVIIGPDHQLLHFIIGEGHGEELQLFMDVAVKYYKDEGRLSSDPLPLSTQAEESVRSEELHFPGKVCLSDNEEKLFVSDSSNHRVLVVDTESGTVQHIFGSGKAGLQEGDGASAQFNTPQGMVFHKEMLYVADTGNHALRKVDLSSGVVSTIAGTGVQGEDKEGGAMGVLQEISSPWDVEKGQSPDAASVDLLFIAMAGTHQIWIHFLKDAKWTKGREFKAGCTVQFSGSGEEANRNNSYPHKACFAQPSAISNSGDTLYVADSESSTVRCVDIPSGSVKALVGGAIDPLDLFAFGDTDGKGRDTKLQHPLGVAWSKEDGMVYVADSYNHKIKVVNPRDKTCTTLTGTGEAGLKDGSFENAQFSEPGGLCLHPNGRILFIADTNNHKIRKLDLDTRIVSQIELAFPKTVFQLSPSSSVVRLTGKRATTISLSPVDVPIQGKVQLSLSFKLPQGCHWTEDAPSAWQILPTVSETSYQLSKTQQTTGSLHVKPEVCISLDTHFTPDNQSSSSLEIEAVCYICEVSGVCHMKGVVLVIPLVCSKKCADNVTASLIHSLQL